MSLPSPSCVNLAGPSKRGRLRPKRSRPSVLSTQQAARQEGRTHALTLEAPSRKHLERRRGTDNENEKVQVKARRKNRRRRKGGKKRVANRIDPHTPSANELFRSSGYTFTPISRIIQYQKKKKGGGLRVSRRPAGRWNTQASKRRERPGSRVQTSRQAPGAHTTIEFDSNVRCGPLFKKCRRDGLSAVCARRLVWMFGVAFPKAARVAGARRRGGFPERKRGTRTRAVNEGALSGRDGSVRRPPTADPPTQEGPPRRQQVSSLPFFIACLLPLHTWHTHMHLCLFPSRSIVRGGGLAGWLGRRVHQTYMNPSPLHTAGSRGRHGGVHKDVARLEAAVVLQDAVPVRQLCACVFFWVGVSTVRMHTHIPPTSQPPPPIPPINVRARRPSRRAGAT